MRDPDLVVRAQQAATAMEIAWRRWRDMHGLGTDPLPAAVSSYVGYSLEVPWGQARVVLGICAEDAERLAALLEGHDCVGPVHAAVTAGSAGRSQGYGHGDGAGQPGAAKLVHVPAPAPASAGQQPLSAESAFSRPDPLAGRSYRDPAAASALTSPSAPYSADIETPIALAASRAVEASMASRSAGLTDRAGLTDDAAGLADTAGLAAVGGLPAMPATQPFPWAADLMQGRGTRHQGPTSPADHDEAAADHPESELDRVSRVLRGASLSTLKREGTASDRAPAPGRAPVSENDSVAAPAADQGRAESPGWQQGGRDRISAAAANADAATWAASELPGQAAATDTAV